MFYEKVIAFLRFYKLKPINTSRLTHLSVKEMTLKYGIGKMAQRFRTFADLKGMKE